MTKQREIIKNIIMISPKHLTAEEIFFEARSSLPKIAFGTVYRNLGLLVKDNEIRKIDECGDIVRYDRNLIPHEHIVCSCCGRIDDIKEIDVKSIIDKYVDEYNITGYKFMITHICKDCKKNIDQK